LNSAQQKIAIPKGIVIFFILFSLFSPLVHAQDDFTGNVDFDTLAYWKTLEICGQIDSMGRELQVDWGMIDFIVEGVKGGLKLWGDDVIQSKETKALLASQGYELALAKCYNGDHFSEQALTWTIRGLDIGGHVLGFLAWGIPMEGLAMIFKGTRLALVSPRFFGGLATTMGYVQKAGFVALGTYVGWKVYAQQHLASHTQEALSEFNQQMVEATQEQAQATFDLLQQRLNEINRELAAGVQDEGRRKFLVQTKAKFEERLRHRHDPPPTEDDQNAPEPISVPSR
jgi:hypothetical protein